MEEADRTVRDVGSAWRRVAAEAAGLAGYGVAVLAGGYGLGFWAWARGHRDLLAGLVLANQLPAGEQAWLLRAVVLAAGGAFLLWLVTGLLAGRDAAGRRARLKRTAALWLAVAAMGLLPLLALPGIEREHPFVVFGLVAALAGLVFAGANLFLRLVSVPEPISFDQPFPAAPADAAPPRPWPGRPVAPAWRSVAGWAPLAAVALMTLGYVLFMSLLTVGRHNAFMTHSFDLGIHDQIVYNALHSGYLRSTQHGAEAINYLREHFAPILYLVAPIYALHQEARTLLVLQSLLLGLGAVPVFLLARRKTASAWLAASLAAAYLLFPALQGVNTFDFHQIVLATPLLMFSLYFLEEDRTAAFLVTLGLAMLAKEEVALTAAAVGVYAFLARRRYGLGALVTLVSLAYFVTVVKFVMPALGGAAQVNRFAGLMAPGESGFGGVAITLLTNPWYVVQFVIGNHDKMVYLAQLLLPVCLLPLLGGLSWLAALAPLGLALLSSAETQYTVGYHYPASLVPGIFFAAIAGSRRLDPARFRRPALALAVLAAALAMSYEYGWIFGKQFQGIPRPTPHQEIVARLLKDVPATASVSTMSDLAPHLSNRKTVHLFPIVNGADYLVLDMDPTANFWPFIPPGGRSEAQDAAASYLLSGEYGVVKIEDGALLLRRGAETARNDEGLRAIFAARYLAKSLPSAPGAADRPDPTAGAGEARVGGPDMPRPDGTAALTFGPYVTLPAGKYRVIFRLKLAGPAATGKVATLDVFSTAAGGPLAGTDVAAADFRATGTYQPFTVDLETGQPWQDLEFRVRYAGQGELWADTIEVLPLRVAVPGTDRVIDFPDPAS